jgi:hypothetical protein
MKIIKKPDTSTWKYTFTCASCTAELEAEATDIVYNYYSGDYRESGYETFSLTCPVCSHSHTLKKDFLPKIVQLEAKKKSR